MKDLRPIPRAFPKIHRKKVTLIRVTEIKVTFADDLVSKRQMLAETKQGDRLMAVWTGEWSSRVFHVDDKTLSKWKETITEDDDGEFDATESRGRP